MRARKTTKLVHEGRYAAEVEIELLEEDHESRHSYLSMADAKKLDEVRLALRKGDLAAAGRLARVHVAEAGSGGVGGARLQSPPMNVETFDSVFDALADTRRNSGQLGAGTPLWGNSDHSFFGGK